jgi:hypothetical protein
MGENNVILTSALKIVVFVDQLSTKNGQKCFILMSASMGKSKDVAVDVVVLLTIIICCLSSM